MSPPLYDIVFNYTDGNTSYAATANAAAAFWELAITGDLPDINGVDDLRVNIRGSFSDRPSDGPGKILATAGWTALRPTSHLAYTGEVDIDSADLSNSGLTPILVHEIGHIIGLSSDGPSRNLGLVSDVGQNENRWNGSNAVSEYRILANDAAATFVRMQDDYTNLAGQTQNGGHWHEGVFGTELMTSIYNSSSFNALSRMSLAALRDLGYPVDLGYADPFALGATPTQFRDDRSGNYNTSTTLTMNSSLTGSIELAEDNDWFRVSLVAGTAYTFELNGAATGAGTLADPFLSLRALDGEVLRSNNDNGASANSRFSFTPTTAGQYFVDASANTNGTGSYTLSASNSAAAVGSVAVNDVSITEGNSGAQVATFTVARTGGAGAFAVSYATADGTATIGDYAAASGTLNFAAGVNSQTVSVTINGDLAVEPNETFFVNLSGATNGATISDAQGVGTIVNDDQPPSDDFRDSIGDTTAQLGSLTLAAAVTGNIETAGDLDVFATTLTAGRSYTFALRGAPSGGGTLGDPYLTLRNSAGAILGENDDYTSLDSLLAYAATATGTYYVEARAFASGLGTYTLSVTSEPAGGGGASQDFNADGRSDLVWRHAGGAFVTWEMNGATPNTNGQYNDSVGNEWQIRAQGDFDGDGRGDLFWRHTGGAFATWSMNGATASTAYYNESVSNDWAIRATGDFNGDGTDDLLWRNYEGGVSIWNMFGTSAVASTYFYVALDWKIVGAGDFNGDGTDDLLWRNDNGDVTTWQFNNNVPTHNVLYQNVATDWHVLGTGDFNGDNRDDILWRQDGGVLTTWEMNGATRTEHNAIAVLPEAWDLADVGDWNGDGRDDLAWRHDNGTLATWEMNGPAATTVLYTYVDPTWALMNQQYEIV